MSRISWNKPIGKRKANSSRLAIGWRSPKGICKLSSKPGNPHLVVLLVGKSVFPRWRKMMSWPRPFNCRARLPTVYGTPPIVSSPEVTSRILTVIQKFGELIRILIHHRGTEYAEIYHFKLSPPRPRRLRGEFSKSFFTTEP